MCKMKNMKALAVDESNSAIIQEFLQKYEFLCVSLCSLLRKGDKNIFVFINEEVDQKDFSSKNIWGVVHVESSVTHCLPFYQKENKEFEKIFAELLESRGFLIPNASRKISCVDGEKRASELLVRFFQKKGQKMFFSNEYFLMTKEDDEGLPPPASLLSMGEEIVCCKSDHSEDLYDLQYKYLKEEVFPPGKQLTDFYVRSNLKALLKNQKVFAIESDGKLVSKVNSNAIGWNCVQIGGVYTDPLYRRNGYSFCLLSTLCRRINKTGRKCVLFVKKKNLPALGLYEKLDFRKSGEFQISYFE